MHLHTKMNFIGQDNIEGIKKLRHYRQTDIRLKTLGLLLLSIRHDNDNSLTHSLNDLGNTAWSFQVFNIRSS